MNDLVWFIKLSKFKVLTGKFGSVQSIWAILPSSYGNGPKDRDAQLLSGRFCSWPSDPFFLALDMENIQFNSDALKQSTNLIWTFPTHTISYIYFISRYYLTYMQITNPSNCRKNVEFCIYCYMQWTVLGD